MPPKFKSIITITHLKDISLFISYICDFNTFAFQVSSIHLRGCSAKPLGNTSGLPPVMDDQVSL